MDDEQIKAGAQDAARELGIRLVAVSVHPAREGRGYGFRFDARGWEASVEFVVTENDILWSGNSPRVYARYEVLEALQERRSSSVLGPRP